MANLKDLVVNGNSSFVGKVRNNEDVETKGRTYVHTSIGEGGAAGYIKIAQIKITTVYQDVPIVIELLQRRSRYPTILYIAFQNASNADPALGNFHYSGEPTNAYMVKSATSTWDLYIQKKESYDGIHVVRYNAKSTVGIDVVWIANTQVATLPTGATLATLATLDVYASTAKSLFLNPNGRQTSANVNMTDSSKVNRITYMLATSSMTEGKPPSDAHILNLGWDNNQGWGAQIAIGNGTKGGELYSRGAIANPDHTNSIWDDTWKTFLNSSNYNNYAPTKTGGGASGTWGIGISGNAATATKATQDSAGQQINTTYIKNAAVSGKTVTFTRGDGSTFTITTQDTNSTYSDMKGATSSAAGTHGLVPAPAAGAANRYLRSDGTWSVPPDTNTTYSVATTSANGLMAAADKTKLNGLKKYTKWGDFKS